jgi:hypothetical protein
MAGIDILQFKGIAPNVGSDVDFAELAEDVDLSGGVLRGFPAHEQVAFGHYGEFVYFNGEWVSGDTDYLPTRIEGANALIFKRDGTWMVKLNGTEAPLWVNAPAAPVVTADPMPAPKLGTGSVIADSAGIAPGTVDYYSRYLKLTDGVIVNQSDFSSMFQLTSAVAFRTSFTLPTTPSTFGITHIELYRRRSGETSAGLVIRQDINTPLILDSVADADLGEAAIVDRSSAMSYAMQYLVSWVRNVGGWVYESAPSPLTAITGNTIGFSVARPASPPDSVTGWRIYRISTNYDPTVSLQLVADLDISVTKYSDSAPNFMLGESLASEYVSSTGAPVTAGVPTESFTGIAGPVNGYYIAWVREELFLSEPGNPSWWPGAFAFKASGDVVGVDASGDRVIVVTDGGVQIGYGNTPDTFTLSPTTTGEGSSAGRRAVADGYYLGYDGIYEVAGGVANIISDAFPAAYFRTIAAVSLAADYTITMNWANNRLFLLHSSGALCYDGVSKNWVTLSAEDWEFSLVHAGELYFTKAGRIYKAFSSATLGHFRYTTGRIVAGSVQNKFFEAIRVDGDGLVSVVATVKGVEIARDTLDLDSAYDLDRYLYLPNGEEARAIQITFLGDGLVRSVHLDIYEAESEAR